MNSQPQKQYHILMVEDDQFVSTFLNAKLTDTFKSFVAPTTKAAREILGRERIDIILLDIMMPDESGFSLLEDIKRNQAYAHIPVLIISNYDQEEDIAKGYQLGAIEYLVKANHTPAEIISKIEAYLAKNPPGPAHPAA